MNEEQLNSNYIRSMMLAEILANKKIETTKKIQAKKKRKAENEEMEMEIDTNTQNEIDDIYAELFEKQGKIYNDYVIDLNKLD